MPGTIGVIGGGYVGLVTAACFSSALGRRVRCAESEESRLALLAQGKCPIFEPGLSELVSQGVSSGNLSFTNSAADAAGESEFIFICVQTPPSPDGTPDMTFVEDAARQIGPVLSPRSVVINKSTMPVGSTERVRKICEDAGAREVHFVSNPEFLREGSAIYDFMHPDRIVIGSTETEAAVRVSELYKPLNAPVLITDPASAELIKYSSNAYLAMRLSFVNALAELCDAVGADISEVALGMGYDRRIGFEFLKPGPGFGGSCFPKDTQAMLATARAEGVDFPLLEATLAINEEQIERVFRRISEAVGHVEDPKVAAFGLAFKANTDDVRESPAIAVIERLVESGIEVVATDPAATKNALRFLPQLRTAPDPYSAAEGCDCVAILTEWDEYRWLDYAAIGKTRRNRTIVDARNILDPLAIKRLGFVYKGIGR
jgi:UDPglucose 6-dehydrogenase